VERLSCTRRIAVSLFDLSNDLELLSNVLPAQSDMIPQFREALFQGLFVHAQA
jgi:hypothetical protein